MFCPVCNGMETLQAVCAECSHAADDWGRAADYNGPYSPYQSFDLYVQSSIQADGAGHCKHICRCGRCGHSFEVMVAEKERL